MRALINVVITRYVYARARTMFGVGTGLTVACARLDAGCGDGGGGSAVIYVEGRQSVVANLPSNNP